jgi:hypothetical protein
MVERRAERYVKTNYPRGFVFRHTDIEAHPVHSWDSNAFIEERWPDLPVMNTGRGGNEERLDNDINLTFALMKRASGVVLSSSVMMHAADAMNIRVDAVNYGTGDLYNLPIKSSLVRNIRWLGQWRSVDDLYGALRSPTRGIGWLRGLWGRRKIALARRPLRD